MVLNWTVGSQRPLVDKTCNYYVLLWENKRTEYVSERKINMFSFINMLSVSHYYITKVICCRDIEQITKCPGQIMITDMSCQTQV